MVGAVLGLFVRPLQRNEARHVRRVHAAARAGGGGAAAGRQRGGGRESQHVGALPTAVDRARAAAARPPFTPQRDVRLHGPVRVMSERHSRREHHEPGAARRSLRPHGASWRLISSEGACLCPRAPPCSLPCPKTDTGANHGHDRGPGWRRSCRLRVRGGNSTDRGT